VCSSDLPAGLAAHTPHFPDRVNRLVDARGVYHKGEVPGTHGIVRAQSDRLVEGRAFADFDAAETADAGPLVLTGFIDVQKNHVYYEVCGWGSLERCWLIDWGTLPCPSVGEPRLLASLHKHHIDKYADLVGENWSGVADLVNSRVYPRTDTGEAAEVRLWGVDSGDGNRTAEVYHFCSRFGERAVACKGVGGASMAEPYRERPAEKAAEYGISEPLMVLQYNVKMMKDTVFRRNQQIVRGHGACLWPDLSRCSGEFNAYARQLSAEELVTKSSRYGSQHVWELRPGRKDNHYLDCRVGNLAVALAGGLRELEDLVTDPAGVG